jgi:hypothetical protein
MQIMTEAAIRLGGEAERIAPGPDWEGFRGMGNLLRHAYHRIDDQGDIGNAFNFLVDTLLLSGTLLALVGAQFKFS